MKGKAIAGLVLSIVSVVLGWWGVLSLLALPMAIVGLVLSVMGGKQLKAAGQPAGIATAGMILGIIAVVLNGILFFTCGLCSLCAMCGADAIGDATEEALEELGRLNY